MKLFRCLALITLLLPGFLTAQEKRRTDLNGDELPPGAIARIGSARFRHTDEIYRVAISPDSSQLASTSKDGLVSLWDAKSGKLIARRHAGEYAAVAFGDKGETVGTFSVRDGYRLFSANLEREIRSNENRTRFDLKHAGSVAQERQPAIVLAPGLKWLAYQIGEIQRCRMIIGHPETSEEVANLTQCKWGWLTVTAASQDGRRLAIGDGMSHDSTVWIVDPLTGKEISHRDFDGLFPGVISINRDGSRVAIGARSHGKPVDQNIIFVWDTEKGNFSREIPVRDLVSHSIALSPDGERVAVTQTHYPSRIREEYRIDIYDVKSGKVVQSILKSQNYGRIWFSPDGTALYYEMGCFLKRVELETEHNIPGTDDTFESGFDYRPSHYISFREDGIFQVRTKSSNRILLWEPKTGKQIEEAGLPSDRLWIHACSPDGRQVIYSDPTTNEPQREFHLWDRELKKDVAKASYPNIQGGAFHFSADNRDIFLFVRGQGTWRLNRETLERDESCVVPRAPMEDSMLWSPLITGDGRWRLEVFSYIPPTPAGSLIRKDLMGRTADKTVHWAPDSTTIVTAEYLGDIHFFRDYHVNRDGSRAAVLQFAGYQDPRQKRDCIRGRNVVSIFDIEDDYERCRIEIPLVNSQQFYSGNVVLSPDGRLALIYGSDHFCSIFETASGTRRYRISTHEGPGRIPGVGHYGGAGLFSPNGRYLVTYNSSQGWLTADLHSPEWHARSELRNKTFELPTAWDALQIRSAEEALPALNWLIAQGDRAADFMAERIRIAPKATQEDLKRWLAELDSDEYDERIEAEDRLLTAAGFQEIRDTSIIRQSRDNASANARRAIDRILDSSGKYHPAKERIRAERALEVLERIDSAKSRQALSHIANGHPDYWLRRDARAALLRLGEDW